MFLFLCMLSATVSSFLLFLIQPMAAKVLLPLFGGVPSVWNVCMVFFQGVLLLGYAYAFLLTRNFSFTSQRWIHVFVMCISFLCLPILWKKILIQPELSPTLSVLELLAYKITLPLFIVSATAPLIQYWFSRTHHPDAEDPYFLYSASNVGSLLALISFPFLLEPYIGLQDLSYAWSIGYVVFVLCLFTISLLLKSTKTEKTLSSKPLDSSGPGWNVRAKWLLLSFAPSCLLIAVTQYITTEIVSAPLFWLLPLAVYLICFIIVFSRKPIISQQWMVREQALFLIFPMISLSKITLTLPSLLLIIFHMLGFFALVMVCLGELIAKRPSKFYLTEFYLWIAFGGFLGGIFTSLLAPLLFKGIYEYYIAFCLCICLRPLCTKEKKLDKSVFLIPIAILALLSFNYFFINSYYSLYLDKYYFLKWVDFFIIICVITYILLHDKRPVFFALNLAILFSYSQALPGFKHGDLIWQARNFFGVIRIYKDDRLNLHVLMNGSTLHGVQILNQSMEFNRLTSYYQPVQFIANMLSMKRPELHVAIAGLGTGLLGCQFRSMDEVTFFEIDPNVITVARNPKLFTYVSECPPRGGIRLGDARLNIAKIPDHYFDAIIIDTFSSDAIPTHLFTSEAIQLYFKKLSPGGLLIFNISNRHIELAPVLLTFGLQHHLQSVYFTTNKTQNNFQWPSEWFVLTSNTIITKQLTLHSWINISSIKKPFIWTDDFSNILKVLK